LDFKHFSIEIDTTRIKWIKVEINYTNVFSIGVGYFVQIRESFNGGDGRSWCVFNLNYAHSKMRLLRMCAFSVK